MPDTNYSKVEVFQQDLMREILAGAARNAMHDLAVCALETGNPAGAVSRLVEAREYLNRAAVVGLVRELQEDYPEFADALEAAI